ncbi:MAG: hypothetical protein IKG27_05880 [Bacilli bacterium]|nr:hypothetical protein [Bacilli bacterium]
MNNVDDVVSFLKEHRNFYSQYFEKERLKKIKYGYTCDINQIFCHLNKVPITQTDYYLLTTIISKYFDLNNKKILEVACGYIPILSSIIKEKYSCEIKAINNKILFHHYKGVETEERDLFKSYDLSGFDLIIGFRPCEITETIILECFKYKKNFAFYLCPCVIEPLNKSDYVKETWTYEKWHNYIINLITSNINYECIIIKKHCLEDDCPIIIAKYLDQDNKKAQ